MKLPRPAAPPTPEDELALLLVGTAQRRRDSRERIRSLSARVDEERLAAGLLRQRIFLLAGTRLVDSARADISLAFRAWVEAALSAARLRAMVFETATEHVAGTLERAGIPAVALKGGALSAELYGDAALRAYEDIDMLVPVDALDRAVGLAASLGWTVPDSRSGGGALPSLHRALRHPGGAPELELHWRIHWYESRFSGELIQRSRMVAGLRRLDPFDELAALLLFYARDGFAGLRLAADIAAWWDRHGSPAALDALERRIAAHPSLARPWRAALAVSARVAGLPPVLIARFDSGGRRGAVARRLANWDLRGDADQIMANVTLVDGLLAPPGGLSGFLGRRFAPTAGGAPPLNVAKSFVRYAIALWQLRRGRCWSPIPVFARPAVPTISRL